MLWAKAGQEVAELSGLGWTLEEKGILGRLIIKNRARDLRQKIA